MAGLTDHGLVRKSNEDYVLTALGKDAPPWALAVAGVFDGVGGLPSGEEASSRAALYLQEELRLVHRPQNKDAMKQEIHGAMLSVHELLLGDGRREPRLKGMATTATVAIVSRKKPHVLVLGHVGDGAAFVIRDQRLERLTPTDALPIGPARWGPATRGFRPAIGNQISQALGHRVVVPHTTAIPVQPGDFVVLGTDGLVGEIGTDTILHAITKEEPLAACQFLVDSANSTGGTDNVSVAVIKIT